MPNNCFKSEGFDPILLVCENGYDRKLCMTHDEIIEGDATEKVVRRKKRPLCWKWFEYRGRKNYFFYFSELQLQLLSSENVSFKKYILQTTFQKYFAKFRFCQC